MFKFPRKKKSDVPKSPPQEPSPEVIQAVEEEFPEEDSALKREHFERVITASPSKVYETFVTYVWRQNAGVTQVEIVKDSAAGPNELEAGMVRRVTGFEEEVINVKKSKLIEFKLLDGMPTSYHKSRILFKPEEDGEKTRVIWTIWWSPTNVVAGMLYTIMMKGYCNLALYRLEQAVVSGQFEEPPSEAADSDQVSHAESSSTIFDDSNVADLNEGEVPKLQWAARLLTGYEGNLTPDQEQALNEMRESIKKSDPELWDLCQKHPDGPDRIMLRFLRAECTGRARKFHVEKSKKRLGETLRFRRDIKADELITKDPPHFDEFVKSGNEFVVPDREGRCVVFTRVGILSTCLDTKIMSEEDWKRNLCCISERRMQILRENSKRLGHEVSAQVVVYDVRGVGFGSRKIIPFTKFINDVASKHYPEFVDMIIVTHAPAIFAGIFATVKGFLDPVTASKVRVFGTSKHDVEKMKATLRSIVDPKLLPREFGGESSAEVGYPNNYKGEKYAYD